MSKQSLLKQYLINFSLVLFDQESKPVHVEFDVGQESSLNMQTLNRILLYHTLWPIRLIYYYGCHLKSKTPLINYKRLNSPDFEQSYSANKPLAVAGLSSANDGIEINHH